MAGRVQGGGSFRHRGQLDLAALRRWTWVTFWVLAMSAALVWVMGWR